MSKCKWKNPIITCTWTFLKHWTQLWGTIVQQQASRQKGNLKVGKYVQMYRAPFLYLPGAPNSLNPPLDAIHVVIWSHLRILRESTRSDSLTLLVKL